MNEVQIVLEDLEELPDIAVVYGHDHANRTISAVVDLCPATSLARQMLLDGQQPIIRLHPSQVIHPEKAA